MSDIKLPPAPSPRPAVRPSAPKRTGDTVVVACKMSQGLILRAFKAHEVMEPQRDGGAKPITLYRATGEQHVIKGTQNASAGQAFQGNPAVRELLPGGYALTWGVPKGLWENWLYHNRDSKLVKEGVIFAMPSMPSATAEAQKRANVRTGLEPVDQGNPAARMPGGGSRAEQQMRRRLDTLETGGADTSPR